MQDAIAQALAIPGVAWVFVAALVAGVVRGLSGFGTSMIFLPVAAESAPDLPAPEEAPQAPAPSKDRLTILAVDDDVLVLMGTAGMLEAQCSSNGFMCGIHKVGHHRAHAPAMCNGVSGGGSTHQSAHA